MQEVDVWVLDLRRYGAQLPKFKLMLSESEHARAHRFKLQAVHDKFICVHGLRRQVLARYMNAAPQAITYSYRAQGKPYIKDSQWSFNSSDSGDYVVLAVSRSVVLGVDIEYHKMDEQRCQALAQRFFTDNEAQKVKDSSWPGGVFYPIWVCKEAYVKMLGVGLKQSLSSFEFALDEKEARQAVSEVAWLRLKVPHIDGFEAQIGLLARAVRGYSIALATQGARKPIINIFYSL